MVKFFNMRPWTLFNSLYFLILFVELPIPFVQSSNIRLNVPRVRLPYFDTISVSFLLYVDTPGCYKWSVSRTDLISLTTPDGKQFGSDVSCSENALITTIPQPYFTSPLSAIVFAEEPSMQETVRCDVIIDKIKSIKIVTTINYVHLEEAPSKFHVRAYGTHNNEFSTLDGVPMKWWLESPSAASSTSVDPYSVMRFLPFSSSLYETKPGIAALEAEQLQGSEVLVEGLKTGSALLNARIESILYKDVPKSTVKIVAVANLLLEPGNMCLVPENTIPLKLIQIKKSRHYELRLPSETYIFEVENKTVANYDEKTSTLTGLAYGETKISVRDKYNFDDEWEFSRPLSASIHVREPKILAFRVTPCKPWVPVVGKTYAVTIESFDPKSQKTYIGNVDVTEMKKDPPPTPAICPPCVVTEEKPCPPCVIPKQVPPPPCEVKKEVPCPPCEVRKEVVEKPVECIPAPAAATQDGGKSGMSNLIGTAWLMVITVVATTVATLLIVNYLWKYQEKTQSDTTSDYVFVTKPSPSPRNATLRTMGSSPIGGSSSSTPPDGRRLFSTDSGFKSYRPSSGSAGSSSPGSPSH